MLETGTEDGGVSADDVARAFKYRKNGKAARSRRSRRDVRAHDSVRTP